MTQRRKDKSRTEGGQMSIASATASTQFPPAPRLKTLLHDWIGVFRSAVQQAIPRERRGRPVPIRIEGTQTGRERTPSAHRNERGFGRETAEGGVVRVAPCVDKAYSIKRSRSRMMRWRRRRRSTIMSTNPCSCRNSDFWNPSGKSDPIVSRMTRGPANPMSASGSAM